MPSTISSRSTRRGSANHRCAPARLAPQRAHDEVVDRAFTHLARTIDVERANGTRREAEYWLPVVQWPLMLGGQLGHGIGPARSPTRPRVVASHSVTYVGVATEAPHGGEIASSALTPPLAAAASMRRACAEQRHAHGEHGVLRHGADPATGSQVNDCVTAFHGLADPRRARTSPATSFTWGCLSRPPTTGRCAGGSRITISLSAARRSSGGIRMNRPPGEQQARPDTLPVGVNYCQSWANKILIIDPMRIR